MDLVYRFEFNPPRVTSVPYVISLGRRLKACERDYRYNPLGKWRWLGFGDEKYGYGSKEILIDGILHTHYDLVDVILLPTAHYFHHFDEMNRFKNVVAGVLGLSAVLCLDLVVRVVCFL